VINIKSPREIALIKEASRVVAVVVEWEVLVGVGLKEDKRIGLIVF